MTTTATHFPIDVSTKVIQKIEELSNGIHDPEKEHLLQQNNETSSKNSSPKKEDTTSDKSLNILNARSNIPYADGASVTESDNYIKKSSALIASSENLSPASSASLKVSRKEFVQKIVDEPFVDAFKPSHQKGPDYIIPSTITGSTAPDEAVALLMEDEGAAAEEPVSVVTFFERTVRKYPDGLALAVKRNDQWLQWTYSQYLTEVRTVAKGFIKLGLEPMHGVGILGFNAPEWAFSAIGAIYAGGLSAGIYATNSPEACLHVLRDSSSDLVVVENETQLKKILSIRNELPHLKAIIQYMGEPTAPGVLSWSDLLEIGRSIDDEALEKRIKSLSVNQCCTLIYTSGTTGSASGAMLSHDNVVYLAKRPTKVCKQKVGEVFISYLPLSHVAAQVGDIYIVISCGGTTYFATPDALKGTLVDTLKEVRPHYIFGVPRIWEKMAEKLKETESRLGFIKRMLFRWARNQSTYYHKTKQTETERGSIFFWLARKLVLDKVRKALGLDRALMIICGGGPLLPEILAYFISLNMFVNESYGMSESSGPNTSNQVFPLQIGSVGIPFPSIHIKIENAENGRGEICMKGRNVFMGYLKMPEKTKETLNEDGWMLTGDIGYLTDDNHLYITGRIKEIIITAGGENVAPVPIEDKVKGVLPIISNCMLIGDKRKFLSLLLTLKTVVDVNTLLPSNKLVPVAQDWCRSVGSKANTIEDILEGPDEDIMDAIQEGINHVNKRAISNAQRIQKWKILPVDFSLPGGELGPSMKLKRTYVLEKFSDEIDNFYLDC